jgi:hypothetical protein
VRGEREKNTVFQRMKYFVFEGRRQKAEGRRQKAEGRRQKAEGRRQIKYVTIFLMIQAYICRFSRKATT